MYTTNELCVWNTETNRMETNVISDAAGNVAYEAIESYHLFDWGWELVSTVSDPLGAALTTSFDYWPVPDLCNTCCPGDPNDGHLRLTTYPDGTWEGHEWQYINGFGTPVVPYSM